MTKAGSARPATPAPTPVQAALADSAVQEELARHAAARLGVLLADRPRSVREDVAKDAVQEASRRALSAAATFDASLARVAAWLHGILERVLHEHCRALRKQPAQPCADPAGWDGLEANLASPESRPTLMRVLDGLPAEQRQIVAMHHLDGMPHEQIGAALGISVGCSRVRLARVMSELKRLAAGEDLR